jgi:hypothetical protein
MVGRLLGAVALGNSPVVAARFAGVSEATFYRWKAGQRPAHKRFAEALDQAKATAEVRVVTNLHRLALRSTPAARLFLTLRFPERWSGPRGVGRSRQKARAANIERFAERQLAGQTRQTRT